MAVSERSGHSGWFCSPSSVSICAHLWFQQEGFMSEFKNVTVVKKANVYFDGKVTSRTVR